MTSTVTSPSPHSAQDCTLLVSCCSTTPLDFISQVAQHTTGVSYTAGLHYGWFELIMLRLFKDSLCAQSAQVIVLKWSVLNVWNGLYFSVFSFPNLVHDHGLFYASLWCTQRVNVVCFMDATLCFLCIGFCVSVSLLPVLCYCLITVNRSPSALASSVTSHSRQPAFLTDIGTIKVHLIQVHLYRTIHSGAQKLYFCCSQLLMNQYKNTQIFIIVPWYLMCMFRTHIISMIIIRSVCKFNPLNRELLLNS